MMPSHHGVNDPPAVKSRSKKAQMIGNMSAPPNDPPVTVEARCVRLPNRVDDPASLALTIERHRLARAASEVLIELKAAAVNPSDVKAATGLMPYAVFPRTPGRDYAGTVIGVVRKNEPYEGHASSKVDVIDASSTDIATRVRELTDSKGADIVFNTVGDPYFQAALKSLALRGRQILIAAINPIVPFNILEFYRGQHTYVGVDTLALSSIATGAVLRELVPGFAGGHLKPFPIRPDAIYPLEDARRAFAAVARSSRHRVILRPA